MYADAECATSASALLGSARLEETHVCFSGTAYTEDGRKVCEPGGGADFGISDI